MSLEPTTTAPAANAEAGQQAASTPASTPGTAPAPAADAKSAAAPAAAEKSPETKESAGQLTAALVRREQETVRKQQELAKREAAMKEQLEAAAKYKNLMETISKDPLSAAEALGLDYETMTRLRLDRAKATITPEDLKRELDARERAALEAQQKREAEAQAAAQAQAAEEVRRAQEDYMADARAAMDSAPDDYELLRDFVSVFGAAKGEELVWDIARAKFREEQEKNPRARPLSAKEAVALAEAELVERGKKLLSSKKLAAPKPDAPKAKPPVSLSNDLGASATGRVDSGAKNGDADFGSLDWARRRMRELDNQSKQ